MRPLICGFSKISNSGKNIRDAGVLGWGWPIFPNLEKPKEHAAKAVNSLKEWLPILTARLRTWKRARNFIIHTDVFLRPVRSYSMDRRDFPFPYGHQMPRSEHYSFLQDLSNTPSIWPVVSAEQRKPESQCYLVRPHGKRRDWTQFHRSNFLCAIEACIFTCWNATV